MARNPHPRSIEELERDDQTYGPSSPQDERRMLVELSRHYLDIAWERIWTSRVQLARIRAKVQAPK